MANPVKFTAAAQTAPQGQIACVQWDSASTAGDVVELVHAATGETFWRGRASGTQTFLGTNWPRGISANGGLRVQSISSGTVLVYYMD